MLRRSCVLALALASVGSFTPAVDMKELTGKVKSVALNGFTITDRDGRDWGFMIDKDTHIIVKGATHKMDRLKADGRLPTLDEFLAQDQFVYVKYWEKGTKLVVRELRILDRAGVK
jgi:hypothetical protein